MFHSFPVTLNVLAFLFKLNCRTNACLKDVMWEQLGVYLRSLLAGHSVVLEIRFARRILSLGSVEPSGWFATCGASIVCSIVVCSRIYIHSRLRILDGAFDH